MNREIKFRAWDGKRMWHGWNLDGSVNGSFHGGYFGDIEVTPETDDLGRIEGFGDREGWDWVNADNVVLMQYTGLKDKAGVEICEGDVIRTGRGDWGVIVYKAPFYEVTVSAEHSSLYSREWLAECIVIGNIYENPELLEAKGNL